MRQLFLDTETTGLAASQGDRIVEIIPTPSRCTA